MNPHEIGDAHSEDKNQEALFCWLRMFGAFGKDAANDPRSYFIKGHAPTVGIVPSKALSDALWSIHGIMNGLKLPDSRAGGAAKAMGLTPGVPDIFVPFPTRGYPGFYIELKIPTGKPTESQKKMIPILQRQGYLVEYVVGWRNAAGRICWYLNI